MQKSPIAKARSNTQIFNPIPLLFYLLFFCVPLVLYPYSFELFEFNKMVLTYALTAIIAALWLIRCVLAKKFIFRRTTLDIPILIFLGSQFLSTIISIDNRTSLLGYYSRFHGGLLSSISYSLLYWAYVSNMDKSKTLKAIYSLLASATLVSLYAILEHFGIDKNLWVQDVQSRVFSTLGQPNWLAAWVVALTPITWAFSLNSKYGGNAPEATEKKKANSYWVWITLSAIFFLTLIFTRSRSGMLGFAAADLLFWALMFLTKVKNQKLLKKNIFKNFIIYHLSFLILVSITGTPWSPSIKELIAGKQPPSEQQLPISAPALEVGGTEFRSREIRRIVWNGALDIWKNYPILGTGVETFAFAYYKFRPAEHNLVSEWDFLYNKAHNEYLNFTATTGALGLSAYIFLIAAIIFTIVSKKDRKSEVEPKVKKFLTLDCQPDVCIFNFAFLAGFMSILVTNFFGFSVVPVALQFFLYPAMTIATIENLKNEELKSSTDHFNSTQKLGVALILCAMSYTLFAITKYWYADLLYARGKAYNDSSNYTKGRRLLEKAVKLSPNEAIFRSELSQSIAGDAVTSAQKANTDQAIELAKKAISESERAISLSPANVNLKRDRASSLIKLSIIDPNLLVIARDTLKDAVEQAPTDAKLYYNLALSYIRTGDNERAIEVLRQTIELKPDFTKAHYALGLLYIDEGKTDLAKQRFEYILENLDPNDPSAKKELEALTQ